MRRLLTTTLVRVLVGGLLVAMSALVAASGSVGVPSASAAGTTASPYLFYARDGVMTRRSPAGVEYSFGWGRYEMASPSFGFDGDSLYAGSMNRGAYRTRVDGVGRAFLTTSGTFGATVAGGKVYWLDYSAREVQRANLDGTSPETVAHTWSTSARLVAVDPVREVVYWADMSSVIFAANLDGSNVHVVAPVAWVNGIALSPDGESLYVGGEGLWRLDVDTAQVQWLAWALILGVTYGPDGYLYYATMDGTIVRANPDGTGPEVVVSGIPNPGQGFWGVGVAYDETAPSLNVPGTVVVEATSAAGATATFKVSATDPWDPDLTATCSAASGSQFSLGDTIVACSATDESGNTAVGTFTVHVQDTTAPVFTAIPGNFDVPATGPTGAVVTFTATASDTVDGAVTPLCAPAPGSTFPINGIGETTVVTCSATDNAGNTSGTVTFTVHVQGAGEQLDVLIAQVDSLNLGKLGTSLHDKLATVHRMLDAGKANQACDNLQAFINQVQAQSMTVDQSLAVSAQRIKDVIGW